MRQGYTTPPNTGRVGWTTIAPSGSGVSVAFPAQPRIGTGRGQDDDGAPTTTWEIEARAPFGFFGMFVVAWEGGIVGDPLPGTTSLARSVFDRGELHLERSQRIAVEGFFGREDIGSNEQGAFVALRQFVGSDRAVMAVAVVPRNSRDALAVAERFMGSIVLDRRAALFPTGGARRAGGRWTPLYVPESDFGIRMPAAPDVRERRMRIGGAEAVVSTFGSRDEWGTYRVRVIDFPSQVPDGAFEEVCQRLHLTNDVRPVESAGFPGRVYTGDGGGRRTWARVFRTSGRIYVVQATGPRSGNSRARSSILHRFFESFRIL